MPLGDALTVLLHSLQDPRVRRVGARVRRAAGPVVRGARRRIGPRLTLRAGRR